MNNEKNFMDLFEEIFGHPFDLTGSAEENKEEKINEKTHEENLSNLFDTIFGSFQSSCPEKEDTEEKNDFDVKDFAWIEAIKKNAEASLIDSCDCPKVIICCPDSIDKILDSLKDIQNKNLKDFHKTVSTLKATDVIDLDKRVYGSLVKNSDSRCEIHYHDLEQELYIACNDLEELQRAVPKTLLYDNHHGYTFNYSQGIFFYTFPYDALVKFNATTVYHI